MTLFIKEKPPAYKKHDQLYKDLIHTFFEEFLEGFFPDVHALLDFQSVKSLPEEIYTDILQAETRRLDIVKEAKIKGTDTSVILHIEPQSYVQGDFNKRMYQYYSLLYNKYDKDVLSIAVFSYKAKWEKNHFIRKFPFIHTLTYHYQSLHLKKIENWQAYTQKNNPAVAALLSEMGYKKEERIDVMKAFLHMLNRMELDPARERIVYDFFESYLKLTEEEEEELMKEIENLPEAKRLLEIPISIEERGKELGKELGKKEVAKEMLKKGLDIELIREVTHLDEEEIRVLGKTMN